MRRAGRDYAAWCPGLGPPSRCQVLAVADRAWGGRPRRPASPGPGPGRRQDESPARWEPERAAYRCPGPFCFGLGRPRSALRCWPGGSCAGLVNTQGHSRLAFSEWAPKSLHRNSRSTPPTAQASMLLVPTVCQRRNALMKEHAERGHSEDERLEPEMASPLPVPIAPVQSRCSLFSPTALSGRTQALRSAWRLSSIRPSRTSATLVAGAIAALSIPSKRSSPQSPRRSASMVPKIARCWSGIVEGGATRVFTFDQVNVPFSF